MESSLLSAMKSSFSKKHLDLPFSNGGNGKTLNELAIFVAVKELGPDTRPQAEVASVWML